ncbi:MAG: hypothetical protein QXW10_03885, partial [Candidatus Micrarchaeaceae archaeon]
MQPNREPNRQQIKNKRRNARARIYVIIIIVAIIAAITYSIASSSQHIIYVRSQVNVSISHLPNIFNINGNEYAIYLAGAQNGESAQVYIAQMPAMVAPLLRVNLTLHNVTKINAGSAYTTIEMKLNSFANGSIGVTITPVSANLSIAPDASMIKEIEVLPGSSSAGGISIQTNSTTTIGTTITTTSVASTTTIKANTTNVTHSEIEALLNKDVFYPLMANYTVLYRGTVGCTPQLYNSTYISNYGSAPTPTYSYQNVSLFTPYNMLMSIEGQKDIYIVSYKVLTRNTQFNNTVALSIEMNLSSGTL